MSLIRCILIPFLVLLVGCASIDVNKDYVDIDKQTAVEIEVVAPIYRRSSVTASICQPGRKGQLRGNKSLHIEAGVPTLVSVSERIRKPGAVESVCNMNVLFSPSPLKKYYVDMHGIDDKCYLSVDYQRAALILTKQDVLYESLVKKEKQVSCNDVVSGAASAKNIDEAIEKSVQRKKTHEKWKQAKRDKNAADSTIKKFSLSPSGQFIRNDDAFEKIEKNGVIYYLDSFLEMFKAPYYVSVYRKDGKPMTLREAEGLAVPYIKPKGCTSPIVRKQGLDRHTEDRTRWLIGVEC